MHTSRPEFVEHFVRTCFEKGYSEKFASTLLEVAIFQDALRIPAFAEGAEEAVKAAGVGQPAAPIKPGLPAALKGTLPNVPHNPREMFTTPTSFTAQPSLPGGSDFLRTLQSYVMGGMQPAK